MSGVRTGGNKGPLRVCLVLLVAGVLPPNTARTECVESRCTYRTSRVFGQVRDSQGALFAGAHVEILRGGERVFETETDERGFFHIVGLAGVRAEIRVSSPGFQIERCEVTVEQGAPSQLLAVSLGFGECGGDVCAVPLPPGTVPSETPRCLIESPWAASERKKEVSFEQAGARCAAGDHGACRKLARVAEGDEDSSKRQLAAKALSDQALLLRLVARTSDSGVRAIAVGKVGDQKVVAEHAVGHADERVRAAATAKLADGELLARIAVSDANEGVRAAAVRNPRLTDPRLFAEIAQGLDTAYVRQVGVARIADPALLRTLALGDPHQWIRAAAASNPSLDDQELLVSIARNDQDSQVRAAAARGISDPELLKRATLYVDAETVRQASAGEQLIDVARNASDPSARSAAVSRISDAALIAAILENDKDDGVRMHAALNPALTDQGALARAAQSDSYLGVKVHAASRLDDQELAQKVYAEVIASGGWGRWHYAIVAASHITDQLLLARIATTDQYLDVRREATRRLEDQAVLSKLAVSAGSTMQQMDAIDRLNDPVLLRKIASGDPDWFVRKAAQTALARQHNAETSTGRPKAAASEAQMKQ